MERYNTPETGLEIFSNFVGKSKETFAILSENIKANIKKYEASIEMTERDIFDSETAREKCEREIAKMEDKISTIKDNIENVESTYKKIVDAYAETSKGGTKEIYSNVIAAARTNCEEDVEKNRSEIAKLNSDIEGIRNNIAEFTRVIDSLNRNLDHYRSQLAKYTNAGAYLDETREKVLSDLEDIADGKSEGSGKTLSRPSKAKTYSEPIKYSFEEKDTKLDNLISNNTYSFDKQEEKAPEKKEDVKKDMDESLQRIYDLTGYKPQKKEETTETKSEFADSTLFGNEFDSIFENNTVQNNASNLEVENNNSYDNNLSEWENILNSNDNSIDLQSGATVNIPIMNESDLNKAQDDSNVKEANELLKPYGTSFERLSNLVGNSITYKDGKNIAVTLSTSDVVKAVNSIDSLDLKSIKTVGPEVTLLRKIKHMKEGLV